ncbi:MAG: DegV family protein [Anaerolineae bacterium]|nr:DegV family protein [Anaerolineae bacterium]
MPSASIAVVTDSAAGIPASLLQTFNIQVVPYYVHLGDTSYVSGVDIQPETFFQKLRAAPSMPVKTGIPSVAKFLEVYQQLARWAKGIVSVHVAGNQSGTCNAAELAGRESPIPVAVVDTETTAMAEGFMVLLAARAAKAGETLGEIVSQVTAAVPHANVFALLESVSYALQGGRLSAAAGRVGSMLNIQPLIRVHSNRVSLVGQVRRRSKGLRALIDRVVDDVRDDPVHLTVHFAEDEDEGRRTLDELKSKINCVEHYLTRVPVELGVHAGPGSIGIAYYIERDTLGLREQIGKLGIQAKQAILSHLPVQTQDSNDS